MYGRDPVDSVDLLFDAVTRPTEKGDVNMADWVTKITDARHYAQQHLAAVQEEMVARANKNRRSAFEIEEGTMVYFKPRQPYKAKLDSYGLGIYRVVRRKGNFVTLQDTDGGQREANIRDLVLIREANPGVTELEGYQLLYALLHGADKVPAEAGEASQQPYQEPEGRDYEPTPFSLDDAEVAHNHIELEPSVVSNEEVETPGTDSTRDDMEPKLMDEDTTEDDPDRITDMAKVGRRLKVKIGYAGCPDSPRDTPTWFFFDELEIPEKHEWKKTFEQRRKDSLARTRK